MPEAKPWHEDESFWELWGPTMFSPHRIAEAVSQVDVYGDFDGRTYDHLAETTLVVGRR